jgi:hypothetical protein
MTSRDLTNQHERGAKKLRTISANFVRMGL